MVDNRQSESQSKYLNKAHTELAEYYSLEIKMLYNIISKLISLQKETMINGNQN